jgi:hypothetical protein
MDFIYCPQARRMSLIEVWEGASEPAAVMPTHDNTRQTNGNMEAWPERIWTLEWSMCALDREGAVFVFFVTRNTYMWRSYMSHFTYCADSKQLPVMIIYLWHSKLMHCNWKLRTYLIGRYYSVLTGPCSCSAQNVADIPAVKWSRVHVAMETLH